MGERELPEGWEWRNLEDVTFFQEGPGIRKWQFNKTGTKLLNVGNLVNGALNLDKTDRHVDEIEVAQKYSHFLLDPDDIVMASSGATWGKTSVISKEHLPLMLNTSTIRLRSLDERKLDKSYLLIFLNSRIFKNQIDKLVTGSAQPNFGSSHLKQVKLLLPPLPVQHQIVAVLEQAEAVKRQRQEADALTGALLQSVFYEMFGDPVRNEREWDVVTVDSISEKIQYGYTESANIEKIGPKFLRITDIQNNGVNWDQVPYCKISNDEKEKYLLKTGDILFARTGATVGKSFRIDQIVTESIFASYLIRVCLSEKVDSNYVFHFFQSPYYWSQIQNTMVGAGQPGVNATKLAKIKIPLPSLALQQQFARIVKRVERIREQQVASGRQIEGLCEGLMASAFSGTLKA